MTHSADDAALVYDSEQQHYVCQGKWTITTLDAVKNFTIDSTTDVKETVINGKDVKQFDSAGALSLITLKNKIEKNTTVQFCDFTKQQQAMLNLIIEQQQELNYDQPENSQENILYKLGKSTIEKLQQADGFIVLIGSLASNLVGALTDWRRFRIQGIMSNLYSAGIQALPIVALLAFLIGVVLAYQMGLQLQTYGANSFIAYLSGMAIFREFAPLITAIIVAGRTSSAFTAQLGSMKINEEIDALETMGLSPAELLVVPKVIALLLIFPLLIFWGDLFSVIGAMMMSKSMLDINYLDFLTRLRDSVGLQQFCLGLYKAPAFALIISLVGCYQGFLVKANADSIGKQTTKSVVQALFLIIIADALFSIVYSWMGL